MQCKTDPSTKPDPAKICDYSECTVTDPNCKAVRLACFHTIHMSCLALTDHSCPICTPHLSNTINNLAASFNEGLLKPTSQSSPSTPRDTNNNDDSNEQDNINHLRSMTDPAYYQSAAWESHIDSELASFHVTQP